MIAILWREWRTLSRSLVTVVIHFVTPLFLLVFFATVLGRNLQSFAYNGQNVGYLDFFAPGLIGYVTFMTFQISVTFVRHDRMSGMLGIVSLSCGGLHGYVGGKLIAQIVINILKAVALALLAITISNGHIALFQSYNIVLFAVAVVLGSIVWMSLGITTALLLKRDDMREVLMILISMPIAFASTMYYDISRAPTWIAGLSTINPLTYICNLTRQAYLAPHIEFANSDLYVLVLMAVASFSLACLVSRKVSLAVS